MIDKTFLQNIYKWSFYFSILLFLLSFKYFWPIISLIGGIFFSLLILKIIEIIVSSVLRKDKNRRKKHLIKLFLLKYFGVLIFFYFLVKINYVHLALFAGGIALPYCVMFIWAVVVFLRSARYA